MIFTRMPWAVQRVLFGVLAPIARLAGLKGSYPEYMDRKSSDRVELESLPAEVSARYPSASLTSTPGDLNG